MSEIYRDYGQIRGAGITGTSNDITKYSQVHQATHSGTDRLPFMKRSFISFSFSNKGEKRVYIEDFNLIATISNNRWERNGYSDFDDVVSDYDNLDGQYYWGTHYKSNTITFNLSTDGIDQKMLEEFLYWFSAGSYRELILSEHPNRAQMARVVEPPQLRLLPFQGEGVLKILGKDRKVTTTLYKGEIILKLIMDEPHWYSLDNILGIKTTEVDSYTNRVMTRYIDKWIDANGNQVEITDSEDALKILYEDGIPLGSAIENNMLFGNKAYANVENSVESKIWSIEEDQIEINDGIITGEGARIDGTVLTTDHILYKGEELRPGRYTGIISGAVITVSDGGITSLDFSQEGYFFYAGTAPSPTIISFTLDLNSVEDSVIFDEYGYFACIGNKFTNSYVPYSKITIQSTKIQELTFTTPNLITSYNTAVDILKNCSGTLSVLDLRKKIIAEVHHPAVRQWVNALLSLVDEVGVHPLEASVIRNQMSSFFKLDEDNYVSLSFSFNSKTGEALGEFEYRKPEGTLVLDSSNIQYSSVVDAVEDVGDMLTSNNIILTERNYTNDYGKIVHWQNTEKGKKYSHKLTHNLPLPLENLQVEYNNMYL